MAKKQRGIDLSAALHPRPMNLAISFGLAVAVEIYLLSRFVSAAGGYSIGMVRLAVIAMTLLPVWVISYCIVSLVMYRK